MSLDFEFTEKVITLKFFTVFDIMTIIGGFNASLLPAINMILPLFVLYFLFQLGEIIRDKLKYNYYIEMRRLIKISRESIIKLDEAIKKRYIKLHKDVIKQNRKTLALLLSTKEDEEDLEMVRGIRKFMIKHMKALEENKVEEEKPAGLNIALLIKAKLSKNIYSGMRNGISNIETNKLKHIIQPI